MSYSKIVTLREMRPAYNIKEESSGEWKTFIANDQFNGVLQRGIRAVRNNDADNGLPVHTVRERVMQVLSFNTCCVTQ